MAYDIGPRLGIDGYAEFRKSIASINEDVKTFGSELKLVAATYDEQGDSMEALAAKNDVLKKTYDAQKKKVAEVEKVLEKARAEYGDNETAVKKWEQVLLDSKTALQKTQNEMDKNNDAMKKNRSVIEKLKDAFKGFDGSIKSAKKAFKDLGESADNASGKFDAFKVAAGNLISGGVSAIAGAVGNAVSAFVNLDESTEEYRIAMGKLNTAFESAGYSSEVAQTAYQELYKILGDTDNATEAAQLMAQLAESEEDMATWTEIAAGVAGVFGDSLPVNSMMEFLNETVKTGEVTGDLTRMLEQAGIDTEEFQKQLDACSTESERNTLLMETLSGAYGDASDAFYENNEELIRSRENQAKLDEVTGRLGESVLSVKNALIEKFGPALIDIGNGIADFIDGIDTDALFKKFDEAWNNITEVWGNATTFFSDIWNGIKGIFSDGITIDVNALNTNVQNSSAANRDNSAYYSSGQGNNAVYLDGKRVGNVLNMASGASNIASGPSVNMIP